MFHPYAAIEWMLDDALDGSRGLIKGIQPHEFYETDFSRGYVRGF